MPDNDIQKILLKEIKRFLGFLILGALLIIFNPDIGSWKYPMGFSQEVRVFLREAGRWIMIAAYPASLFIRGCIFLIRKIRK